MAPPGGTPTPFTRDAMLARLRRESFDVLVVGGGITGAWVALDAASRGLRTALVERDDLASGTSSKSSKLVHGGLRYLQNGDVRLVYEALHERRRLMRAAPHLVDVMPFMIPVLTRDGLFPKKVAKALGSALWMYDLTGGWRIGKLHRRLDARQAHEHLPTMPPERLAGGYLYFDAAADDARLALTVARTAAEHGAVVVTRCPVVGLLPVGEAPDSPVRGALVAPGDEPIEVSAEVVVNATGVWADDVARLEDPARPVSIRPAKGVHVTVPWELVRNDIAVVVPVRQDKRSLFVIPWGDNGDGTFRYAYVGTTDTDHDGSLDDPQCDATDLEYVLRALNDAIAAGPGSRPITVDDVTAVWAGLRPLLTSASSAATADLSRNHRVSVGPRGVVDIAGGKLTTGRLMAEHTIDEVERRLGRRRRRRLRRSPTRRIRLFGATRDLADAGSRLGHLHRRFGSEAATVLALVESDPSLGRPLVPGLPFLRAEAIHAVRHEMALTLVDVLTRRTRCHLEDRDATEAAAPAVAELLAAELGWDDAETERQLDAYRRVCAAERTAAELAAGSPS